MSLPTLTPTSKTSAITLPETGSAADVTAALPLGVYSGSQQFLTGAAAQVAFVYKRLGGDILDIEITAKNVYASFEDAVLEYSYIVNLHQSKNALGTALGSPTASFDHKGEVSAGADGASLKFPKFTFDYAFDIGDTFATEAGIGGTEAIYSASFSPENDVQDYDLQKIVSSSAVAGGVPYAGLVGDNRIKIRQMYYVTPRQMWRFYGYYGGLNVVGDMHTYGQYADESTFQVIPA